MKRLLIVSDSPALFSGLARVVRELVPRLSSDYRVTVGGWHHIPGMGSSLPGVGIPYNVVPLVKEGDPKAIAEPLNRALQVLKPEVVLAIGDPWDFAALAAMRTKLDFKLVGYLNIESAEQDLNIEQTLDAFDLIVTTSKFGEKVLRPRVVSYAHHGVDTTTFFPIPGAKQALGRLAGHDLEKTFVVLINAQNTQRKNLATALRGFAQFAEQRDNVLCFANTLPSPQASWNVGPDLEPIIARHGIEGKVVFNRENLGPMNMCSDEDMNRIYGIADALLITSTAEGFGLPLLEAMATCTIPIAPDAYSATELLSKGRGLLIPIGATCQGLREEMVLVSTEQVAEALDEAYRLWRDDGLEEIHSAGLAYTMSHSWDVTARRLLDEMAVSTRPVRIADGNPIDPILRARARRIHPDHRRIGVLKLGGLGDMLQTTAVVRALHEKYESSITVFTNSHPEIFQAMPEVERVVGVGNQLQDTLVRSIADEFEFFADVRYVSRLYGAPPTEFFQKNRYFYDNWAHSCERLEELDMHTTSIMLASLGLNGSERPIFTPRTKGVKIEGDYLVVATGSGSLGRLKAWPHWAPLANLCRTAGIPLAQIGGGNDTRVQGSESLLGLSLAETANILENSIGLVAVEGGMAHLAAAVGLPSVVLFGPTSPKLFGYPDNTNLSGSKCRPCFWTTPGWGLQQCSRGEATCINHVSASHVMKAIENLRVPA